MSNHSVVSSMIFLKLFAARGLDVFYFFLPFPPAPSCGPLLLSWIYPSITKCVTITKQKQQHLNTCNLWCPLALYFFFHWLLKNRIYSLATLTSWSIKDCICFKDFIPFQRILVVSKPPNGMTWKLQDKDITKLKLTYLQIL